VREGAIGAKAGAVKFVNVGAAFVVEFADGSVVFDINAAFAYGDG